MINETHRAARHTVERPPAGVYPRTEIIDWWESRAWCIYAVPRGAASNAAAGISLEVVGCLFSNVSTAWGAMAFPPHTETARRCYQSATTTIAAAISRPLFDMLATTPNSTAQSPKSNHAVSFLLPRPPSPRPRPRPQPPSSATAIRMILVINSKVWERSGWWRSHAWRGKREIR